MAKAKQQAASIQCRVAVGATYLDNTDPGWAKRINLEILSLKKNQSCVLGQLDDDGYDSAVNKRNIAEDVAYLLGFHADIDGNAVPRSREWKPLTEAWKKEIAKRL